MAKGPIPPLPALDASPEELAAARANIAERCRDRGEMALAASYIAGGQDEGWNVRHEVMRLRNEAGEGGMKPHSCPVCGKGFRTAPGLAHHERVMHGADRVYGPFDCTICGRRTGSSFNFEKHMQSHGVRREGSPKLPVGRRPTLAEIDPTCLECGGEGKLVTGKEIYPHRRDLYQKRFYLCACGAYCGCHPNSVVPLGHPCGPETRRARNAAHAAFDPIWRSGRMTRASAYKWLADELGIDPAVCHIGMMTAERANKVVEIVRAAEREAA